jgi:hypothetical protein
MKDSDSVELKLTVGEDHQRSTAMALGMDPLEAQIRMVTFFDTPDLALDRAGVVVRARRIEGKGDDSVVKLRPVVPNELPAKLRRSENFRVEVDALPGGLVCSGTLKATLRPTDVRATIMGERPIRKLFTKEQRELVAAHAPDGIGLDDLQILGPLMVLKCASRRRSCGGAWWPRCGSIPTARGSSSSRRGVRRPRPSRSPRRGARSWRAPAWTCPPSRRPRRDGRSGSSPARAPPSCRDDRPALGAARLAPVTGMRDAQRRRGRCAWRGRSSAPPQRLLRRSST